MLLKVLVVVWFVVAVAVGVVVGVAMGEVLFFGRTRKNAVAARPKTRITKTIIKTGNFLVSTDGAIGFSGSELTGVGWIGGGV